MDTDKEQAGQIEVVTLDGEKWVRAESLHRSLGDRGVYRHWIKNRVEKYGWKAGVDYVRGEGGEFLLSHSAAARIADDSKRYDEDGLPILPPEKRRGKLINPYDLGQD